MYSERKNLILAILFLITVSIGPNLFVAAQAGYAKLSDLATSYLIPSIILFILLYIIIWISGSRQLERQVRYGILGGLIGTIGLEIFREGGFMLGTMPGQLPKLMGVLLLDRFAFGPNWVSNIAGWSYHFWNGIAFGVIFSLLFGKPRIWIGAAYGFIIGLGFLAGPVVTSLGVGRFGANFGISFPITVTLAHLAFGVGLGLVLRMNSGEVSSLLQHGVTIVQAKFKPGVQHTQ